MPGAAAVLVVQCCSERNVGWFPAGSIQLDVWGSVPGGTGSIVGMIMATVLHHPCGFLVHLKGANLGLAAHVRAEPSALENLVSPA